ncbi:LysR family transcriptional regulator [Pseudonocardia kujensis]|nr:LysR family transcriptional regulator [Pseudonocardia kujensis]
MQAVAASSSFTKAAATEHISPSVLSRRVKEVERLLRVRLFERTTRNVVPTAAGQAFLLATGAVLDDMEIRLRRFMSYAAAETGTVSVATLPCFAAVLLPSIVHGFTQDRPDVTFEIIDSTADEVLDRLEDGTVELGLTTSVDLPDSYCFRPLLEERFYGVAHQGHHWSTRQMLSWYDFQHEAVVATRPGISIRDDVDAAFRRHSISVSQQVNASSIATIVRLVRAGVGVAALPATDVHGFGLDDLVAVPLDSPGATRVVGIAYHHPESRSPLAARFLEFLCASEIDPPEGVRRIGCAPTSS